MNSPAQRFAKEVALRYQLYNGLFLTLPFPSLEAAGIRLPLFVEHCKEALASGMGPEEMVEQFFDEMLSEDSHEKMMSTLFLFVQLVERQIVLFDALEEAAFPETRGAEGRGSLQGFFSRFPDQRLNEKLTPFLKDYRTRVVLTAHPTQFYPEAVLGVIEELSGALRQNDLSAIERLLLQLGKTSFKNEAAPTPLTEALSLLRRSHQAFYESILDIESQMDEALGEARPREAVVELGFWPGGDRDGNPFVTTEATLEVASSLRECALGHYRRELANLRKRLTFPGMRQLLDGIEEGLDHYQTSEELLEDIDELCKVLISQHQSLYLDQAKRFYNSVRVFGLHFASLDLRQDRSVHEGVVSEIVKKREGIDYETLTVDEKVTLLSDLCTQDFSNLESLHHPLASDVLGSLQAIETIQSRNGPRGMHRYIISNTQSAASVLEVLFLSRYAGCQKFPIDLVPLFETIEDLKNAPAIMETLYRLPFYREHLEQRGWRQTVMLGYSDGTKDGGYLSCNWEIFLAKHQLESISQSQKIEIVFFDGRGGPPARGGGNTHKFYQALGASLRQREVQLTIQGQTISSKFGSRTAARYNLEQLMTSGLTGKLFSGEKDKLQPCEIELLTQLSQQSLQAYKALRDHPHFVPFLEEMTPLQEFSHLNIASRPARRNQEETLKLGDLRAIPFVGAWCQMKLNVPGFYGLGVALQWAMEKGRKEDLQKLYEERPFFQTLIDNAMQALSKSSPSYTQYLTRHVVYGDLVSLIHQEFHRVSQCILEITGQEEFLSRDGINRQSIALREQLLIPLVVIQHYATAKARQSLSAKQKRAFEKLLRKTIPAITNASRNSA